MGGVLVDGLPDFYGKEILVKVVDHGKEALSEVTINNAHDIMIVGLCCYIAELEALIDSKFHDYDNTLHELKNRQEINNGG